MVTRLNRWRAAALTGVVASFVVVSAPAWAQEGVILVQTPLPSNTMLERVAYGDLNLLTRAGYDALQLRVGHAVEHVCLYDQGRWYGMGDPDYTHCTSRAWDRARPQMAAARAHQAYYYNAYYRRY